MNYQQLTENERYQIYALLKEGCSQIQIARHLNRHPSTISRELQRNTGLKQYRPRQAQLLTTSRRIEARKAIKLNTQVIDWIHRLICQDLSPQQVVGYLRKHRKLKLHHESIYRLIYRDKAAGGDLWRHLRIVTKGYRMRYGAHHKRRGMIKNRVSIDDRPPIVSAKRRIGDWEGDTIISKGKKSALLTMVERKTLYTVIARLDNRTATGLSKEMKRVMKPLKSMVKTITLDNGSEFADHMTFSKALAAATYFAHPFASWERGINENTNGLIRQYFPKGTDFAKVTDKQIAHVLDRLNNRPRMTRRGKTPNEMLLGIKRDLLAN